MNRILIRPTLLALAACGGLFSGEANALTVTIDGISSPTLLSDAVDTCMSTSDGPDIINITTDTLPTADRQIFINAPITINGDANNNSIPCDVLVDMTGIVTAADIGIPAFKSYLEIQTAGNVTINNLDIHPNDDGAFAGAANSDFNNVSGIRIFKPDASSDTTTFNLTKVRVSGSDASNAFVSLASGADLFNQSGIKRWAGRGTASAGEAAHIRHAAIMFSDEVGTGTINAVLDHCQAGLSKGCAIHISGANAEILGGTFGHSGRDGIRAGTGSNVTIKGTVTDRVRVVRSANYTGQNAHSLEVAAGAVVPLIEYVDCAGENTANAVALSNSVITEINHVRGLGKFDTPINNHSLYITSPVVEVGVVKDSTFVGNGDPIGDPLGVTALVVNPIEFRDCIFTAINQAETIFVGSTTTGVVTFNNCCLTTDGLAGESMADPPITGAGFGTAAVTINNAVYVSPQYLLTLADYDWSDAQGSSDPLNGAGNRNVLRPSLSNAAYLTASSTGGRLTGGAGPDLAGIDDWMIMED